MRHQVFFNIDSDDLSELNNWTAVNSDKLPKNVNLLTLMKDFDSNGQEDTLLRTFLRI